MKSNVDPFIRRNFVHDSQTLLISRTPYDINLPSELTRFPRHVGFFERFLVKVLGAFQQKCRRKKKKADEIEEFVSFQGEPNEENNVFLSAEDEAEGRNNADSDEKKIESWEYPTQVDEEPLHEKSERAERKRGGFGKRKRMLKKEKHAQKNISKARKYRPEYDTFGIPRKKIQIQANNFDFEEKTHKKYDFNSIDSNDSEDDTKSDKTVSNPDDLEKIEKRTQEICSKKFHGLETPVIKLEITKQRENSQEKIKINEIAKIQNTEDLVPSHTNNDIKSGISNHSELRCNDEGIMKDSVFLHTQSKKPQNESKPHSRKPSADIKKTPSKAELESEGKSNDQIHHKNSHQEQSTETKLDLSEDKTHIFPNKENPRKELSKEEKVEKNHLNHKEISDNDQNSPGNNNLETPRKTSLKLEEKSKQNPFLNPVLETKPNLNDYVAMASGRSTGLSSEKAVDSVTENSQEKASNPFLAPVTLPPSGSLFSSIPTNIFSNNMGQKPSIPMENSPINNSNNLNGVSNNNTMGFTSVGNSPFQFGNPHNIENSSNYLSQNSTTSNGLIGNNQLSTSDFGKNSGGLFGNLSANGNNIFGIETVGQQSGGLFGGLISGYGEQSGGSGGFFGGKNPSKKKRGQRIH